MVQQYCGSVRVFRLSVDARTIDQGAIGFKHGAFAHESEWRLFMRVPRDNTTHVRFDQKKLPYMLPYVLMPCNALAKDLLKEIWLAPAHLNEVDTAKTVFSQKSGKPIEVMKSQIPFRKI